MKKLILTVAVACSCLAFGQKKEIANAYKAFEAKDFATVSSQLNAAEGLMQGKTYLLEPAALEQYYYVKGANLIREGKTTEGAAYLAKINDLGKMAIYSGKDSSKNKVYYVGKAAADASGLTGLKEERYTPTTTAALGALVNPIINRANQAAVDAYNAKRYEEAGDQFSQVYNLLKAGGQTNGQMLYNAALSYAAANKNAKSADAFRQLIDMGYTGVETQYLAKNKKSGQVESFDKATWDIMKKDANYADFRMETTPNIEQPLYESYAAILAADGRNDEAIAFLEKALKKYPGSAKLNEIRGNVLYKSGKTTEFLASLREQVARNPNDATAWYNIGVLLSGDPKQSAEAEQAFLKAVAINPKMPNAYQNLAFLAIGNDDETRKKLEMYRKAGDTKQFDKLLEERRSRMRNALKYAEKWYEADPNNLDAIQLNEQLYNSTQNTAKAAEMKAKAKALSGK